MTCRILQRRRLALLAILARARSRGVSRERVLGLLWPERDSDAARHSLSDPPFVIRKALGEEAVLAAGRDLRLNPARVRTDVEGFAGALEGGDPRATVTANTGQLLDGFFIASALDFARWAVRILAGTR